MALAALSKRYSAKACSTSASAALQLADDPAVDEGKLHRARLVAAAVLAFGVHQHEARRVPQLVAEVAVALAAAEVEVERAREARQRGEGEAQRVGAEGRDAVRDNARCTYFSIFSLCSALQQADRGLLRAAPRSEMPSIRSSGIERVALRLRHLLALGVAHDGVDVDVAERHLAGEVQRHHDHPRDPEEDDVEARHQHGGGQEGLEVLRLLRPAERGEGHQRRGEPGVEHVRDPASAAFPCLRAALPLPCGRRRSCPSSSYHAGIWWPHHSWREMHQSWMFSSHWL